MAISFFAYGRDPHVRQLAIDRMSELCRRNRLGQSHGEHDSRLGLVEALADGTYDLAAAHHNCGFPAPLLRLSDSIFEGLPAQDAPAFSLALARAASVHAELSEVARQFLKWMFEAAIADLGPSRIRTTAREAGHIFKQLAETANPTPAQQQMAKKLAKQARRRGLELPTPGEALVAQALDAALDRGGEHAGHAMRWIASLSEQPAAQYRRYARKLLELMETA